LARSPHPRPDCACNGSSPGEHVASNYPQAPVFRFSATPDVSLAVSTRKSDVAFWPREAVREIFATTPNLAILVPGAHRSAVTGKVIALQPSRADVRLELVCSAHGEFSGVLALQIGADTSPARCSAAARKRSGTRVKGIVTSTRRPLGLPADCGARGEKGRRMVSRGENRH